jgi:hypothetical protein
MRIGDNKSASDEVEYINHLNEVNSTLINPRHMDSHGGRIANPIELLKILVRVDSFTNVTDILGKESILFAWMVYKP